MTYVTAHAIDRYLARVKPALEWEAGKRELEALVRSAGPLKPGSPDWHHLTGEPTDGYVDLADGIAGLVKEKCVTTIVTRGGSHSSVRQSRNERKQGRKAARKKRSWRDRRQLNPKREAPWG